MPKHPRKHKLLFDANMSARKYFPKLNKRFDIKHIQMDLNKYGISDPEVYKIAVSLNRVLITQNVKHFRPLAGSLSDCGIIGIDSNLPASQIDKKLIAFFVKHTPQSLAKKFFSITGETKT